MLQHVLPKGAIHVGLIALTLWSMALEPSNHVHINAKRELLFDRTIEQAPFGAGPVTDLRNVTRIDSIIGKLGERRDLGALLRTQLARIALLHTPSFLAVSPCVR